VALSTALFGIGAIFGDDLPREQRFTQVVAGHLDSLFQKGAKATAAALG
jgi:fructuronate reductase